MSATLTNPGWSGGQYSLLRVVLGVFAGGLLGSSAARANLPLGPGLVPSFPNVLVLLETRALALSIVLAVVAGALLALGWHDRLASLVLVYLWLCLLERQLLPLETPFLAVGVVLVAHLLVPAGPYGSWKARGRFDSGRGWRMPAWVHRGLWICLVLGYAVEGMSKLLAGNVPVELLAIPPALWRRSRPWLWLALLAFEVAAIAFQGAVRPGVGSLLLLLFTFDPAWVARPASSGVSTLFYDGHCGLCHGCVRFLLAEDPGGQLFRFAPQQGATFRDAVAEDHNNSGPDSLVLRRADGVLLVRSAAIRHILKQLGGIWTLAGRASGIVPAFLLDFAYRGVAAMRRRLFHQPRSLCPTVPNHLRNRFDE